MIDSTVVRAHHCAVGIKGLGRPRRLADRAVASQRSFTLGFVLTPGEAHDVKGFGLLFRMISGKAKGLLADRGHDVDVIREEIALHGVQTVIPPSEAALHHRDMRVSRRTRCRTAVEAERPDRRTQPECH
jgi:hypothetical protein